MAFFSKMGANVALGYNKVLGRVAPSLGRATAYASSVSSRVAASSHLKSGLSAYRSLSPRAQFSMMGGGIGATYGLLSRDRNGRRGNLGRGLAYGGIGAGIGAMFTRGGGGMGGGRPTAGFLGPGPMPGPIRSPASAMSSRKLLPQYAGPRTGLVRESYGSMAEAMKHVVSRPTYAERLSSIKPSVWE